MSLIRCLLAFLLGDLIGATGTVLSFCVTVQVAPVWVALPVAAVVFVLGICLTVWLWQKAEGR